MAKRRTTTSSFGVSKRENHDATDFYARFVPPVVSADEALVPPSSVDRIYCGDSRHMEQVAPRSVALVVTSPPYFAGKEYEQNLDAEHVPSTYLDYLRMLEEVFTECVAKLEPGGRIAVNVANLGRKPYRSLSADVIGILQDRLRLLLRGEIVWQKARGSAGSCAWGSFQRPTNPVLRDLTERVVVASKGRFDRAVPARRRQSLGHPSDGLMNKDEFLEATTDLWEIPPESAGRVNHPAPFPVELPARLIRLYTYEEDLVLDPFMGSGSTAVAAVRTGRHFVGFDTDPDYVQIALERVERERTTPPPAPGGPHEELLVTSAREGHAAKQLAEALLGSSGFEEVKAGVRTPAGVEVSFSARDAAGFEWLFEVCGGFTGARSGLQRSEILWKALGKAAVLAQSGGPPLVLLTTATPELKSAAGRALAAVRGRGKPVHDVIDLRAPEDHLRLLILGRGPDAPERARPV